MTSWFWKRVAQPVWRQRKIAGLCGLGVTILLLAVWSIVLGCGGGGPKGAPPPAPPPPAGLSEREALIRVRLGDASDSVTVAVEGPFRVLGDSNQTVVESAQPLPESAVTLAAGPTWHLGGLVATGRSLEIIPRRPGSLLVNRRPYHGFLRLLPRDRQIVAVNVVHLEDYVAGVVLKEMLSRFPPEALKAQAIIARTYAMNQKLSLPGRDWDVSDDTSSQVYGGVAAELRAGRAAANDTRGMMLVHGPPGQEQIFPTFYHSTCGGGTVSVRHIKPNVREIRPLAGGVPCDWCASSPRRNWTTVTVAKADFWANLVRANPAGLHGVPAGAAVVTEGRKDSFGRLLEVVITSPQRNRPVTVSADALRMAIGPQVMFSTLVRLTDTGEALILSDGRGWGHGMGLCQYGAAGLAGAGRSAEQILQYYYPGATVRRAY